MQLSDEELTAYEAEYPKEFYTAYFNAIDPTDYANTPDDEGVINRDKVTELKAEVIEKIDAATILWGADESCLQGLANKYAQEIKAIPMIEDQEGNLLTCPKAIEYYQAKIESNLLEKKADVKYNLNQDLKAANAAEDTTKARNIQKALNRVESDFCCCY